jgi:hypothetical protein
MIKKKDCVLYLPSNYKHSTRTREYGRAKSGEVSPKGLVQQTEDWEGRESALAMPTTIHYLWNKRTGEFRMKTMKELIEEGRFVVGKGPQ